jgi:bla regulator protein BlaR1
MRGVVMGFLALAAAVPVLSAQATAEDVDRFEVGSIQPSAVKGERPRFESSPGGGIRATNVTLKLLIEMAYDIRPEQVRGGAGWTDSEEYTVVAKGREGDAGLSESARQERTRKRLQALLRERFRLELKVEKIPAAGYILTVEKKGHKMTAAPEGTAGMMRQVGRWGLHSDGVEMGLLARFLGVHLRATVVDGTGLAGRYNFDLDWRPEGQLAMDALDESLIPAVREQLGLRLEQQKVATERYVIERAEKAGEN